MIFSRYFLIVCILFGAMRLADVHAGNISSEKVKSEVDRCMQAIADGTYGTITEYTCPSAEFLTTNGKSLSREVLACTIKMSLEFNEIDKEALEWEKKLQKQRNKDPMAWNEQIQIMSSNLQSKYLNVCNIIEWKDCAVSTDFYPETTCEGRARAKAEAWKNMGYILAGKGIAKWYQNDKDKFLDEAKSAYDVLLNKWNEYKRIVDKAVSKFTAYIKNAVK